MMTQTQRQEIVADGRFSNVHKDPPGQDSVYIPPGDIRNEEYRLATFKNFPKNSPVDRADLSSSGFHYIGFKDRVKCFSCGVGVDTWMVGDNPRDSKWHKADCDFANQRDTQNVPMPNETGLLKRLLAEAMAWPATQVSVTQPKSPSIREPSSHQTHTTTGSQVLDRRRAALSKQSPSCQNPVNPRMRSLASRIETFRGRNSNYWPAHRVRATANEVAAAGFFFLGERDRVKCWYCNGGIQNWEYEDDPWIEHAKWFPNCEFVRANKGASFVQQIVSQYPNIVRPSVPPPPMSVTPQPNNERSNGSNASYESNVMSVVQQALLHQNYVAKAKEMGIHTDVITQVLDSQYRKDGELYHDEEEFFEAIFSLQNSRNESSTLPGALNENNMNGQGNRSVNTRPSEIETGTSVTSPSPQLSPRNETSNEEELASQLRSLMESGLCKICKKNKNNIVTIPCGHICTCDQCAGKLSECPSCQTKISQIIKTFRV